MGPISNRLPPTSYEVEAPLLSSQTTASSSSQTRKPYEASSDQRYVLAIENMGQWYFVWGPAMGIRAERLPVTVRTIAQAVA